MISVIVPVYNGEKLLKTCIDSILKNIEKDDEVIIVNDGSTDNTPKICSLFAEQDNRIQVIQQENSGVSRARNSGIKAAKGEWILFVDADDTLISGVSRELKQVDNTTDFVAFGMNGKEERNVIQLNRDELLPEVLGDKDSVGFKMNAVWSKAYRRTLLAENHISFDEKIFHGEDMIFNVDVALACSHAYIFNKMIYRNTVNFESATHKYQENSLMNEEAFIIELNKRLDVNHNKKIRNRLDYMIVNGIWIVCGQNICNEQNKISFSDRKALLRNLVEKEPYKTVISSIDPAVIDKNRRALIALLKRKRYAIIIHIFMLKNKYSNLRRKQHER